MPLITWDEKFLLNNDMIDKHHKHLVELLNRTYEYFVNGGSEERLGPVLHDLINYATYHFCTEERFMEASGYPGLQAHREEHARFVERVVRIQQDFHQGQQDLSEETISFLRDWITNHILWQDVLYGEFEESTKEAEDEDKS